MKRDKQCPKCSSRKVGYSINDVGSSKSLSFGRGFGASYVVEVKSERWLCLDCGYVEVYAVELEGVDWLATFDEYFGPIETGPFR